MTPRPPLFVKQLDYDFLLAITGSELGRRIELATYKATYYDGYLCIARNTHGPGMSGGDDVDNIIRAVIGVTEHTP